MEIQQKQKQLLKMNHLCWQKDHHYGYFRSGLLISLLSHFHIIPKYFCNNHKLTIWGSAVGKATWLLSQFTAIKLLQKKTVKTFPKFSTSLSLQLLPYKNSFQLYMKYLVFFCHHLYGLFLWWMLLNSMEQSPSWEAKSYLLVKKFAFYGTWRLITMFTRAHIFWGPV